MYLIFFLYSIQYKNIRATHPFVFKEKYIFFHNKRKLKENLFVFQLSFCYVCLHAESILPFVSTKLKPKNVIQYFIVYINYKKNS